MSPTLDLPASPAGAAQSGCWYAEQRGLIGWSPVLFYDRPIGAAERDEEQKVKNTTGSIRYLRRVRRVPAELTGTGIDAIRAALFPDG